MLLVAVPFVRRGCRHVLLFRWKIGGGGCSGAEPLGVSVREGSVNAADAPRLLADGSIYVLAEPRNAARLASDRHPAILAVQRYRRYLP